MAENLSIKVAVSIWNKLKLDLPFGYFVTFARDAPTLLVAGNPMDSPFMVMRSYESRKIFWRLYRWEPRKPVEI